ncbi:hypothetical protein JHL17_34060 [Azospirillum sp. YIM B02556]|uniref:Uncharacterized protein n=1 Tax=Azospirillum endophyticum TaxID=2800326 RepID=A0ABS1FGV9_9PROT|nr:hypothetical protein [Azospirillum endophyticum]MBK1842432.1 hypothetical protein [Azospirillum endophyticum]
MGDVHRLQVSRRLRIARPLTIRQSIEGIVADLERLPQQPDPADVRTIAGRLHTLADRLERDGRAGTFRET